MSGFFKKAGKGIDTALGIMGFVGIMVMAVGVLTRYVFKVPFNWSDELLRTLFVWGYFIGAAMMYSSSGIMRLELFDSYLERHQKKRMRKGIKIVVEAINAVFFSVLSYYVFVLIATYVRKGTTSQTSNTPAWVLIAGVAMGFVLIAVFAVRNIIRTVKDPA
jgi:TRAP-type C4-dicarboxylate transport system permease small subunit